MFKTLHFKALVFDLDDTLLDTYNVLIPQAINKAGIKFQQMTGIDNIPAHEFSTTWQNLHSAFSGRELFQKITELLLKKYGHNLIANEVAQITDALYKSFLQPELPDSLELDPEIHKLLLRLKPDYNLYLVTQGIPEVQTEKVQKLKISNFFKQIFVVNSPLGEKKTAALKSILKIEHCDPERILSIGNRLSHEISMAKQLNMQTCHVAVGEHKDEKPTCESEIADWTIVSLKELEEKCQL